MNQSSGCISFITTTGTEGEFIDLKWMKKVEDFWSEALPEEALKSLRPQIRDL
jgi:hypothetical protein